MLEEKGDLYILEEETAFFAGPNDAYSRKNKNGLRLLIVR
jgi:hypothetical protein